MKPRIVCTLFLVLVIVACWERLVRSPVVFVAEAWAQPTGAPGSDNGELAGLFEEDQKDRLSAGGSAGEWAAITARDRKREAKVKELYRADKLRTGADYYHAAMVLQHAPTAEDYLLAHELCIVAVSKQDARGKWLAAATEDRFLMTIGRPQRFGTQYRTEGLDGPMKLHKVDTTQSGVTDGLRRAMNVPTLAEAKERETGTTGRKEEKE